MKERGQGGGPQHSVNATASTNHQPKGVWEGRAAHSTAKATDSIRDQNGSLDHSVVAGGGRKGKNNAEQEKFYSAAKSAKDRVYKGQRLKSCGSRGGIREVRSVR